ncbi:MAG: FAD-binding oxidoreductase [Acidimicrobiales bacterium]
MTGDFLDDIRDIVGASRVVTDEAELAPRLVDERRRYQGSARCLVRPGSTAEVAAVVAACARRGVPVVAQGGNTGLCGGATPQSADTVVVDIGRMRTVRKVDTADDTLTVECGLSVAEVGDIAARHDRLFPLRFGADATATLGGALATNAGGTNVLRYGMARDLTRGVEVVLADGRVLDDLRGLRKDNTGYALSELFVGSEGTLGIITAATVALFPRPTAVVTAVAAVPDVAAAVALHTRLRAATDGRLSAFEWVSAVSSLLVAEELPDTRVPFAGSDAVLIEVDSRGPLQSLTDLLMAVLAEAAEAGEITDAVVAPDEAARNEMWAAREAVPEAEKHAGGALKHDVSVPVSAIAPFVARCGEALAATDADVAISAFGHLGDGNLHVNLLSATRTGPPSAREGELTGVVFDVAADLGGSFSAEHGIGRLRVGELQRRGDAVAVDTMARIKAALDPDGILNPGAVVADRRAWDPSGST